MPKPVPVIIIVTSLSGTDQRDFLGAWSLSKNFETARFGPNGRSQSGKSEVAIIIITGGKNAAASVLHEAEVYGGAEHTQTLFHPGRGLHLTEAIGGAGAVPSGSEEPWKVIQARSFVWSYSGGGPWQELCNYLINLGRARSSPGFLGALTVLRAALDEAISSAAQSDAETRTKCAVSALTDSVPRSWLLRAPANPLAVIIHDTLGILDAIMIELDSSGHQSVHLDDASAYYKGRAKIGIERLRAASGLPAAESGSQWLTDRGIPTIPDLVKEIKKSTKVTAQGKMKADDASLRLIALLDEHASEHELLTELHAGRADRVSELVKAGAGDSLRRWVSKLRTVLGDIDRLDTLRRGIPGVES